QPSHVPIGGLRLSPDPPYAYDPSRAYNLPAASLWIANMPNYRRVYIEGGCWFFTVNLADRRSRLLTEHIGALREAVAKVCRRQPFEIDAWVVLPDHMHAVWTLPDGDTDFPTRWRLIKTFFSRSLPAVEARSDVHVARSERGIWQRRYWEHLIRDER